MKNLDRFYIFLVLILLISSCTKKVVTEEFRAQEPEKKIKKLKPLQFPEEKLIDILHTKLSLSFNWQESEAYGSAELRLSSYRDSIREFHLDAKSMKILNVRCEIEGEEIKFKKSYDEKRLNISLSQYLKKDQRLDLSIDYIAQPNKYYDSVSGDDKGLYFIDPLDTIPYLMPQIWTQSEPNYASVWFPTLDRPDEKFTQEVLLEVDTQYTTLSNGELISQSFDEEGKRRDHWSLKKPHAPYLTMIAIGEWEVLELPSEGIPLQIFSERNFVNHMPKVFKNTPEMIHFFESLLNTKYPWSKYAQISVRNFVTGAMENTTASVFMEDLYVDSKSLNDEDYDWIIVHELFHQWFGDLVTCKSWSYISLNESFANYSEYLWAQYKHGEEEAGLTRLRELGDYFSESRQEEKPIIRFRYEHPDELFDAHSYSKGGLVLHMLRNELGDDLFFEGLRIYLKRFAHKNVELSDLRKVMEELSGKNLELFFIQWFEKPGHPKITITDSIEGNLIKIHVNQMQEDLFYFPLTIRVYEESKDYFDTTIWVNEVNKTIRIQSKNPPSILLVDPENILLAEIEHEKEFEELLFQYENTEAFLNKYESFQTLIDSFPERVKNSGLTGEFLDAPFYTIRELALNFIEYEYDMLNDQYKKKIKNIALTDPNSYTRGAALECLMAFSYDDLEFYRKFLNDSSWYVNSYALEALMEFSEDDDNIRPVFDEFSTSMDQHVSSMVAEYYSKDSIDHYDWFSDKLYQMNNQHLYGILSYYGFELDKLSSPEKQQKGIDQLYYIATQNKYLINRVMAFQSLFVFSDREEIKNMLIEILDREDSVELKEWFQSLL